ncbi:NCK-interacting protein with SH3 domain-like isoform X2 [Actinia tenebrosa]|nr:NCK-interacting protein with SH3 domain-like isoform X2 [Actinia tenebrosa]
MEVIHAQATSNGGTYTNEQRSNLRKLIEHRKMVLSQVKLISSESQSETEPSTFPVQPSRPAPKLSSVSKHSLKRRAPPVPSSSSEETSAAYSEPLTCTDCSSAMTSESQKEIVIPPNFITELLEKLRINSGISYTTSFVVAETIINHIKTKIPSIANPMDTLLSEITNEKECGVHSNESLILTHDGQCIEKAFLALTEHKDDAQQRSWALHMDEPEILDQLKELLTLLVDANQKVSKAVLQQNDFEYLQSTVIYFQMEHRASIRLQLLQLFGCLCGIDKEVITQLLCSVLPGELARTMQDMPQDLQLQLYSSLVLTMIFSTAEPLPHWLYDQLDKKFVIYLISCIENAPDGEDGDQLIDSFVGLLLAFNQHFSDLKKNLVMNVLATCKTTKNVSEKVMLLINREEDPVVLFDYPRNCSNSVLKFLLDVFASKDTSGLFFTSDMMVLLEILLRQITDLNPGNQLRTQYLSLLRLVFTNTDYFEHKHLFSEIELCLKRIEKEDEAESAHDCQVVRKIFTQFHTHFS